MSLSQNLILLVKTAEGPLKTLILKLQVNESRVYFLG